MKPLPHRLVVLPLLAVFLCALPARAAEKWLRLTSENFDMLSCSSERESRLMLKELEQFRAAFFALFPRGRTYDQRPLFFVFDSRKQSMPYRHLGTDGKPKEIAGVFLNSPAESRIEVINEDIDKALSTTFHEYVHALVAARMKRRPVYFNEGIAEVYETFKVEGDSVTIGSAHEKHVRLMQRTPLIPLGTLFTVDQKSPYYNESEKMNIFYAQSWLLMHYMICGKKKDGAPATLASLNQFIKLNASPEVTVSDAFSQAFGIEYKAFEKELERYLRAGRYTTVSLKIPEKTIREKITCRPATQAECEIELAGLRWRTLKAGDTTLKLLQALEKEPDNPRPYEILAEISMFEKEYRMTQDYLRKAVERKSAKPLVHVWLLREMLRGGSSSLDYKMPEEMSAGYRSLVDRALELAPDCMEAYELLAIIESLGEKMRVAKLNQVLDAMPHMLDRTKTVMALAIVYWRAQKYDAAEQAIEALLNDKTAANMYKYKINDLQRRIAQETGKPLPPRLAPPPRGKGPRMTPPTPGQIKLPDAGP